MENKQQETLALCPLNSSIEVEPRLAAALHLLPAQISEQPLFASHNSHALARVLFHLVRRAGLQDVAVARRALRAWSRVVLARVVPAPRLSRACYHIATPTEHLTISSANP